MAPARVARRAVTDENAENIATTRITRAKTASTGTDVINVADPPKKAVLATKRASTLTAAGALEARKRTALSNISNVVKKDAAETESKKPSVLSKTTKPAGVQKPVARATSTRNVLGSKAISNTSSELKRSASVASVRAPLSKRRQVSAIHSNSTEVEDEEEASENVPPAKNGAVKEQQPAKTAPVDVYDDDSLSLEDCMEKAEDLDAEDMGDPVMVAEYVHEIFDYMRELEVATMPNPDYMDEQTDLEWQMRGILIDWLVEVHTRFRLLPETLFLAINITDRFLSCKVVQLDRLQLVGVTAMFIASKYEEVLSPHVQNFVHVADEGFSEQDILGAERFILQSLDYDLSYPNPMNFLRRISKADCYDIQTRTLGKYLLEIGSVDYRFMCYPPSHVAAGAMYLARLILGRGEWDATLTAYAGYTEREIKPVFELLLVHLLEPVLHNAFFRKYASKKFLKASIILRTWAKKAAPKYLPAHRIPEPEPERPSEDR